ncbi:hypothetical protein DM860_015003 [Cuscuta australis]|uniref:Uncharacterized protein n=1 Tax=Cuscuta australis TaxID=267555 RepID=A0A328DDW0_9ASTE|nr:hypothetical protein DM860_015003 [Cuscuta australis]
MMALPRSISTLGDSHISLESCLEQDEFRSGTPPDKDWKSYLMESVLIIVYDLMVYKPIWKSHHNHFKEVFKIRRHVLLQLSNSHRSDKELVCGNWAWLKLQPYKQLSVQSTQDKSQAVYPTSQPKVFRGELPSMRMVGCFCTKISRI